MCDKLLIYYIENCPPQLYHANVTPVLRGNYACCEVLSAFAHVHSSIFNAHKQSVEYSDSATAFYKDDSV